MKEKSDSLKFPYPSFWGQTSYMFQPPLSTTSGVEQHNTTVYFMNLFKIFTEDNELWISFCVRKLMFGEINKYLVLKADFNL